jgi:hypothetical protein
MTRRLREPDDANPDPRGELDRWLETSIWPAPGTRRVIYQVEDRDPNAPDWWHGDEEATTTFLKSMGVKSVDELPRG